MKKRILFHLAVSTSLFAVMLPAVAQQATVPHGISQSSGTAAQPAQPQTQPLIQPQNGQSPSASSARAITIPQSTGIIVTFPASVVVNVEDDDDEYPLTLPLAQAITDPQGNVIVPQNTPVSIVLRPIDEGAQIVAQSIVVGGQIVPIQATSPVIPATTVTHQTANQRAVENGAVFGRLSGSVFGFMNSGDPDEFDQGAMLGSALGLASGLLNPNTDKIVQIPQGSVYVLALAAPIALSSQ